MKASGTTEHWGTRSGVILAVSGSAVGLGNFLRFPGRAALYGGGAFMIPYFISLLVLGIPICWLEWTLGRYGGRYGFNSAPGLFSVVWNHSASRVLRRPRPPHARGHLHVLRLHRVVVPRLRLGLPGGARAPGADPSGYAAYFSTRFNDFIGATRDGLCSTAAPPGWSFWRSASRLNFTLIYRGLSKGIEAFCKWAMPALVGRGDDRPDPRADAGHAQPGAARAERPQRASASCGIPSRRPGTAGCSRRSPTRRSGCEAAGQIFFSLSVGFGIIITYASYLRPDDDVVLSGLTASATNEFCEVCLGGLITIPAAFLFLGAAPLAQSSAPASASASTPCRWCSSTCPSGTPSAFSGSGCSSSRR